MWHASSLFLVIASRGLRSDCEALSDKLAAWGPLRRAPPFPTLRPAEARQEADGCRVTGAADRAGGVTDPVSCGMLQAAEEFAPAESEGTDHT